MNLFRRAAGVLKSKLLPELLALLPIAGFFLILLQHIVSTGWIDLFLNNSDYLTLPLVAQSIAHGEAFHWVFSSQIFLFPEALIYGLADLLTATFKQAILLNIVFNVLLLYALLRVFVSYFSVSAFVARTYAVSATIVVMLLAILEPRYSYAIAMNFMVSTSYYGVILISIASLWISLLLVKAKIHRITLYVLLSAAFLLSLLTTASNPMYALQFVAPLLIVLCIGAFLSIVSFKKILLISVPQIAGVLGAIALRETIFQPLYSPDGSLRSYVHVSQIRNAAHELGNLLHQMAFGNFATKLGLAIGMILLCVSLFLLIFFIYARYNKTLRTRFKTQLTPGTFIVLGFAVIAPIAAIVGIIITGNPTARYLLPVVIFPLFCIAPCLIYLQNLQFNYRASLKTGICCAAAGLFIVTLLFTHPAANIKTFTHYYPESARCIDELSNRNPQKTLTGGAQYWRARGLQLNSKNSVEVLQITPTLNRFVWLNNAASYTNKNVNFLVIDHSPQTIVNQEVSNLDAFTLTRDDVVNLIGEPNAIQPCNEFDLYIYDTGTAGNKDLNERLNTNN